MGALVLWEVSRKQDYIFSSNRLKENIGASIIIEYVIEELPKEMDKNYEKNVIYAGGGGSLYNFNDISEAKKFIRLISKKIIEKYPGVEVFFVVQEYDIKKDKIIDKIDEAYRKLALKKNRRKDSGRQISFGIERICRATGLPAEEHLKDEEDNETFISKEIYTKIDYANGKRSEKFDSLLPDKVESIRNFDELSKGEKNYLAVIHVDGNRMGDKFNRLKKEFKYEGEKYEKINQKYLDVLSKFSHNVRELFESAFKQMTSIIEKNKEVLKDMTNIKEGKFPLIPIIVAGDDITYVTNGKIGIESVRIFLEYLYNNEVELYKGKKIKLNACAGVAIVRTSYPFAKAYQLAEDLCGNAKKKIIEDYPDSDKDFSLIDWHVEYGDLLGSISEIRSKNYMTTDKKELYMRPLYLNNSEKWTNYKNFKKAFKDLNMEIKGNKMARNKLKQLREVLKKGEHETERFLKINNLENYFSPLEGAKGDYCFSDDKCMYFDAIEVMDLFLELDDSKGDKNGQVQD
jgi:hypothetical protein